MCVREREREREKERERERERERLKSRTWPYVKGLLVFIDNRSPLFSLDLCIQSNIDIGSEICARQNFIFLDTPVIRYF